ncbi:PAS domain S-box protein [Actinoplanes sp. NPDC049118]|uniref:hybrid sensor histidine kinase/response regulator n=1 Tax=Actinoplanes sp. NPDC049118 TaxID=3155769 RepID=UPI0033C015CA
MRKGRWRHVGILATAVLLVIAWGIADLATPPQLMMFGVVVLGPVLAAASARPRSVAAVGVFALLVAGGTSSWQGLAGTAVQVLGLSVIAGTTLLSMAVARHQQVLEGRGYGAAENRSTLAAIVESSGDAIITTDLIGTITTWNDSATRVYGWTAQEAIGRSITMLLKPERAARFPAIMARLAEGQTVGMLETQRIHKDGTVIDVSSSVSPVRDEYGTVVGGAGIERDITARKRAERQRQQILERSARAERLESLGQLAGGIAHDFNNLLAINLNYLEFAREQTTDPEVSRDLDRARAAADRARDLTRQLLLFARKEPANAELIDLNAVIAETRALLQRSIGAHIELVAHLAEEPVTVRADRSRIEQILLNLVINARDAMPDGGVIAMEADSVEVPDDPDRQPPLPAGTYVRLRVTDTGTGIPPEVAAHIFEPFFTTKAKQHGTGLGLATVYGIVAAAGGGITLDSEPGVGTTFQILLPLATADDPPAGAPAPVPRGDGRHILLVEDDVLDKDDSEAGRVTGRILESHGFRVTIVGHGPAALDELRRRPFDLLLTNVIMLGMSGTQLVDVVRREHPSMPVLLISGYAEDIANVHRLCAAGIPVVHRPFTAEELLRAVHRAATAARSAPAQP